MHWSICTDQKESRKIKIAKGRLYEGNRAVEREWGKGWKTGEDVGCRDDMDTFAHRRSCTEPLLRRNTIAHRRPYTQQFLEDTPRRLDSQTTFNARFHTHRFQWRLHSLHTSCWHAKTFLTHIFLARKDFSYTHLFGTQRLFLTDTFTHRHLYIQTHVHRDAFRHRSLYTQTFLLTDLVCTDAFTHRFFNTQTLCTQTLLHTDVFTLNICGKYLPVLLCVTKFSRKPYTMFAKQEERRGEERRGEESRAEQSRNDVRICNIWRCKI